MKKFLFTILLLASAPAFGAQMKVEGPPSAASQPTPALTPLQAREIYILLQGAPMNVRDMQEVSKLLDALAAIANSGK